MSTDDDRSDKGVVHTKAVYTELSIISLCGDVFDCWLHDSSVKVR